MKKFLDFKINDLKNLGWEYAVEKRDSRPTTCLKNPALFIFVSLENIFSLLYTTSSILLLFSTV